MSALAYDSATAVPVASSGEMLPRLRQFIAPANRQLLGELIRADFRVNDQNAFLGILWSLFSPLVMLGIMYFLFKDRFGQNIAAYPAYLLVGLVGVDFFINVTRQVMPLFVTSKEMFVNTAILRETVIAANVAWVWYRFGIELLFCLGLTFYLGVFPGWRLVWALPLLAAFTGFAVGVAFLLALLYAHVRDVEHSWALAMRLLWFVTPIFYALDAFASWSRAAIYWLNPLPPFVIALRGVIMGDPAFHVWVYVHALVLGGGIPRRICAVPQISGARGGTRMNAVAVDARGISKSFPVHKYHKNWQQTLSRWRDHSARRRFFR